MKSAAAAGAAAGEERPERGGRNARPFSLGIKSGSFPESEKSQIRCAGEWNDRMGQAHAAVLSAKTGYHNPHGGCCRFLAEKKKDRR